MAISSFANPTTILLEWHRVNVCLYPLSFSSLRTHSSLPLLSTIIMSSVHQKKSSKPSCSSLVFTAIGILLGTILVYLVEKHFAIAIIDASGSTVRKKCGAGIVGGGESPLRGGNTMSLESSLNVHKPTDYTFQVGLEETFDSCLDPDGPIPVLVMSLGRSGTDSTWQILKKLTGSQMKAIEIVGGGEDDSVEFFKALEGLPSDANNWVVREDYDWRTQGGGIHSVRGFYNDIKEDCANGNCMDGKWLFMWLCEEQQRFKENGGIIGLKWKAYMSALSRSPAYNALKIVAHSAQSKTPIRVIRSRRNPLDVYLSDLKHRQVADLPDHCKADDEECIKQHTSVELIVPVDEMLAWLQKTYDGENEIDALLSSLGIRAVYVDYDLLYYPKTESEGIKEWNRIFRFLDQKDDWEWSDIVGAAGLKPTTKSRSHKVMIGNFDEVFAALSGTTLEKFIRTSES